MKPAIFKRGSSKRFLPGVLLLGLCLAWGASIPPAAADDAIRQEYAIKAAYIYNFVHFIKWPEEILAVGDTVNVCILGEDPFHDTLAPITSKTAKSHGFDLQYLDSLNEQDQCQILFVSSSEKPVLGDILAQTRKEGVLTVGDLPGFALRGGVIGFVIQNGKVRIEINSRAARQANLKISAKLLEISSVVE